MKQKKSVTEGNLFPELEEKKVETKTPRVTKRQAFEKEKQALLERLKAADDEKKSLLERIQTLEKDNKALKVKADLFDELISSTSLFPTTVVAKSFGWSAIKLNQYLKNKGVQFQQGKVWVLYAKYANEDYTKICWYDYAEDDKGRKRTRAHSYWTAKGIMFIRELLTKDGLITD